MKIIHIRNQPDLVSDGWGQSGVNDGYEIAFAGIKE
jgi:hypothetical protein